MIDCRVLAPGDETALQEFLAERLESSIFLAGNAAAAGLVYRGQRYEGTYVAAFEQGRMVGVVAHFWNGNLITQAPPAHLPDLVPAVLAASGRPVLGFLGPAAQVAAAMALFPIGGDQTRIDELENLYGLALADLAVPEGVRSGRWRGRLMEARDLDLMTGWRAAYSVETLGDADGPDLRRQIRAGFRERLANPPAWTWILEAEGRPVATSGFNAVFEDIVQVGGVFTPPELRRRGYGRAAVAVTLLDARAQGFRRSILFTGQENVPAIKAYEALGYRRIGDYRIVLIR